MIPLTLRYWPDPMLHAKCDPVCGFTPEIREIAQEMLSFMYAHNGIGLAAPQVGLTIRMFVLDVWWMDSDTTKGMVFVNPRLTYGKETVRSREGCLSMPNVSEFVTRSSTVHVEAFDEYGEPFSVDADGLFAICIQHENDHLDGLTMEDRLGPMAKRMLRKQLMSSLPPPRNRMV